jgi:hypothetical protein
MTYTGIAKPMSDKCKRSRKVETILRCDMEIKYP